MASELMSNAKELRYIEEYPTERLLAEKPQPLLAVSEIGELDA